MPDLISHFGNKCPEGHHISWLYSTPGCLLICLTLLLRWIRVLGQPCDPAQWGQHHQHRPHHGHQGLLWESGECCHGDILRADVILGAQSTNGVGADHEVDRVSAQTLNVLEFHSSSCLLSYSSPFVPSLSSFGCMTSFQDTLLALEALSEYAYRETNRDFYKLTLYLTGTAKEWGEYTVTLNKSNFAVLNQFQVSVSLPGNMPMPTLFTCSSACFIRQSLNLSSIVLMTPDGQCLWWDQSEIYWYWICLPRSEYIVSSFVLLSVP